MNKIKYLLIFIIFSSGLIHGTHRFQRKSLRGKEVSYYLKEIADLKNTVFNESSQLLIRSAEDYYKFIEIYNNPNSFACIEFVDDRIAGVLLGIKFEDMYLPFRQSFYDNGINISNMFYLGEVIVAKEHRNKGWEASMLDFFERELRADGRYTQICLWCIDESEIAFKKSERYKSKELFWNRKGYFELPKKFSIQSDVLFNFWWKSLEQSD